jgi:hypothetical protein
MCVIGEGPDVSLENDLPADGIEEIEDPPLLQAVMADAATQIASDNTDFCKGNCSYPGGSGLGRGNSTKPSPNHPPGHARGVQSSRVLTHRRRR